MSAVTSLGRVQVPSVDELPRSRPGSKTGGFRSQLQVLRESKRDDDDSKVRDRVRDRDEQSPKRRRYSDDDDVVVWEQPAQPQRPMPELDATVGELQLATNRLARGSAQIVLPPTQDSIAQAPASVAKSPKVDAPLVPLTPLEQAVQDLISKLEAPHEESDEPMLAPAADAVPLVALDAKAPPPVSMPKQHAAIVPAREVTQVEVAQASSHVHLVIDDGAERVVVTVAVRGSEVNVALRGDDATTAALARNAGSLDHAMRARGLDLAEFSAEPDRQSANHEQRDREPERRDDTPKFTLEELA